LSPGWVLALAAVVVTGVGGTGEPGTTLFVAVAAWLTVAGFSAPPYAQLRLTSEHGARAALVLASCALAATAVGTVMRRSASSSPLWMGEWPGGARPGAAGPGDAGPEAAGPVDARPEDARPERAPKAERGGGLDRRRQIAGVLLIGIFPLLTAALL